MVLEISYIPEDHILKPEKRGYMPQKHDYILEESGHMYREMILVVTTVAYLQCHMGK